MGVLYSKIVSTLLRLSGVFVIDVNMAGNIFRAFMMGLELKQHDAVQQALGSAIDKELLKALAAVTRLCVGATARLKFPVINTVNDLPPVLNQLPVADGNSDELAWLFMSHGLNLNSPDYIPAFNPGGVQANMWGSNVQAQKAFLDRFSDELEE